MDLNAIYLAITSFMSPIEIFATFFGLISVYLTVKQNIWCWPTGIVMVILYIFIFFDAKLYSDMGLQGIYVFMQIYGWYHWVYGGKKKKKDHDHDELPVTRLSIKGIAAWLSVIVVGSVVLGYVMNTYTDASFAYYDAFTTVASLVAQWFLAKKILESWVLWITVDVVSISIYAMKSLVLTSGLYVVFLVLASTGLYKWHKSHKKQGAHRPSPAAAV